MKLDVEYDVRKVNSINYNVVYVKVDNKYVKYYKLKKYLNMGEVENIVDDMNSYSNVNILLYTDDVIGFLKLVWDEVEVKSLGEMSFVC